MTNPSREGIFISYSHSDREWQKMLKQHLDLFLNQPDEALYWDDSKIKPGEDWFNEIQDALARTKVAVLLVSRSFLSSQFIGKHELPAIREALQSKNLRIIWIHISFSAYKATWLASYQAAHDPNEPLAKLSSWEQDKVLVDICEKIHKALYDSEPEHPSPPPVKGTDYELIRCDRTRYLNRFTSLMNAGLRDRPGLPQVYFIFGKTGQSHTKLVERIFREVIKPYADRATGAASQTGVLYKKADVSWPDPVGDLETQKEGLQIELSKQYTGQPPADYASTFPASVFSSLPEFSNYRFITVQHTIDVGTWSESEWKTTLEMLKWYLQTYWSEIATRTLEAAGPSCQTQFLIFIKIVYGAPSFLDRFIRKWSGPEQDVVKADLAELAAQANLNFPCTLIDELLTPPYSEVIRWYADNEIYDNEQDCHDAAVRLFETHKEQISMTIIERELKKSLK